MNPTVRAAAFFTAALFPLAAAAGPSATALATVARQLGYHYAYLGPDDAVSLSRPGLQIVVRPGTPLFDLNDRSVPIEGAAPFYKDGEVFVSPELVSTLRRLAAESAPPPRTADIRPAELPIAKLPAHVAIVGLKATHVEGSQALAVTGTAAPGAPITLHLMARLSSSIPDVSVSRTRVVADRNGFFSARVSIAPVYFNGALLTVVANGEGDSTRSVTAEVNEFPNGHTKVPSEDMPRAMR